MGGVIVVVLCAFFGFFCVCWGGGGGGGGGDVKVCVYECVRVCGLSDTPLGVLSPSRDNSILCFRQTNWAKRLQRQQH